jgi:hypothetical protein
MVRAETGNLIATRGRAELRITADDYLIFTGKKWMKASDDINAFCRKLANTWPVPSAESFQWMIRRLKGLKVSYTNTCNGLAATAKGKPVDMYGDERKGRYAPVSDEDNLIDVLFSIRQAYTREELTENFSLMGEKTGFNGITHSYYLDRQATKK